MDEESNANGEAGASDRGGSDERGLDSLSGDVSRRSVLGLGGLVAASGLLGSSFLSPGSARVRQLDRNLDVNGYDLRDVGGIQGSVTDGHRLESLAGQNISIADGQLNAAVGAVSDDLENRLDDAITRLEVVGGTANSWRVGPPSPAGAYHRNGPFGLLIETDRPAYLGECTIDASSSGRFTPVLYEYDRDSDTLGAQVDRLTLRATGGPQTIFLDFLMDEPGEYLLTRLVPEAPPDDPDVPDTLYRPADDPIELRRVDGYGSAYDADSANGVTFRGGYNPYVTDDPVELYYYYFDLEVASARS